MKSDYTRGVMLSFGTALMWGAMSPIAKFMGTKGVDMSSVMCYRTTAIVVVLGLYFTLRRGFSWLNVGKKLFYSYMLLGMLTIVLNATGFMFSCVYLTVPQALMIHYAFPLCTVIGSYFLTKEPPSRMQILASIMIIVGLWIGFYGDSNTTEGISTIGVICGTLSVIGLAGQTLVTRKVMLDTDSDPLIQLFYVHLFGGIVIVIGKSLLLGWADLAVIDLPVFALMQYHTFCAGLLGFGFMFAALKYVSASLVSLICTLELVFGVIIASLTLGLYPTMGEVIGCAIILASVAAATVPKKSA